MARAVRIADRRGHRGPARRGVPRQQGLPAQRQPGGRGSRVRAQPAPAGHRRARSLPAALARRRAARGDPGGVPGATRGRQDPPFWRQQPRPGRYGRTVGGAGRQRGGGEPAALQPEPARHRIRFVALGSVHTACRSWPIPRSSRPGYCATQEQQPLLPKRPSGQTPAQAALAWLLASDDIIAIPKTGDRDRLRENLGALEHPLTAEQLAELDKLFPPPRRGRAAGDALTMAWKGASDPPLSAGRPCNAPPPRARQVGARLLAGIGGHAVGRLSVALVCPCRPNSSKPRDRTGRRRASSPAEPCRRRWQPAATSFEVPFPSAPSSALSCTHFSATWRVRPANRGSGWRLPASGSGLSTDTGEGTPPEAAQRTIKPYGNGGERGRMSFSSAR